MSHLKREKSYLVQQLFSPPLTKCIYFLSAKRYGFRNGTENRYLFSTEEPLKKQDHPSVNEYKAYTCSQIYKKISWWLVHVLIAMPAFPKNTEEFTPTLIWVKEDLRNQIVRFYLPPTVLVCFGPTWKHLGRGKRRKTRKVLDQFWLVVILHILTMIPRVSPFPLYQRFLNFRITLKPKSRSFESGFFFSNEEGTKSKAKKNDDSQVAYLKCVIRYGQHCSCQCYKELSVSAFSYHSMFMGNITSRVFSYYYSAYFLQRFADNVQTNI